MIQRSPTNLQPYMDYLRRLVFNFWYLGSPPWDTGVSPPELIEYITSHPPGRALDLGCGTGTNAITLSKSGWNVIGVDFSVQAIRMGRQKARQQGMNIDLRVGNVARLKGITGPFDLILDIGCYHSLSAQSKMGYWENIQRLLSEQGTLLMYVFFKQPGESGTGLLETELSLMTGNLQLAERVDGTERGTRPSAWLTFKNKLFE